MKDNLCGDEDESDTEEGVTKGRHGEYFKDVLPSLLLEAVAGADCEQNSPFPSNDRPCK